MLNAYLNIIFLDFFILCWAGEPAYFFTALAPRFFSSGSGSGSSFFQAAPAPVVFLSGSGSPNNFYSCEFILIINNVWCKKK